MKIKTLFNKHLKTSRNKQSAGIKTAAEYGYTVIDGFLYNKNKELVKTRPDKKGYLYFDIILESKPRHSVRIYIHRLVGYAKYGERILGKELVIRHLDGNSLNNMENNLALGTQKDNILDIPEKVRRLVSLKGAYSSRKFTDGEISNIINELKSMGGATKNNLEILSIKYNCSKELIYEKNKIGGYKTTMPTRDLNKYIESNTDNE